MRMRLFMLALLACLPLACNPSGPAPTTTAEKKAAEHDDHDHGAGPHGGTILEMGKYHGEFTVNHDTKEVVVYILSGNLKKAVPIDSEKLTLSIKKPAFQVDLLPKPLDGEAKGMSSRFVAKHDNFGVKQEFAGTVSGEIQGKPITADFEEK